MYMPSRQHADDAASYCCRISVSVDTASFDVTTHKTCISIQTLGRFGMRVGRNVASWQHESGAILAFQSLISQRKRGPSYTRGHGKFLDLPVLPANII